MECMGEKDVVVYTRNKIVSHIQFLRVRWDIDSEEIDVGCVSCFTVQIDSSHFIINSPHIKLFKYVGSEDDVTIVSNIKAH